MKGKFKEISIKHKSLFQSVAPIFTIIATVAYNLRKTENGTSNDIPIGWGYEISIQFIWVVSLSIAIISYIMFYKGQINTSDENLSLKEKIKEKEKLNEEISEKQVELENAYESLRGNYDLFFDKILSLIAVVLELGGRDRISVYFIPKEEEVILLKSRFSKNKVLQKKSNKIYPFTEGFIYKAIEGGSLIENISADPINDIDNYVKEVIGKCKIDEKRIYGMNMKSKSYYIKTIEDETNETIGLIVLESLNINRFDNIDSNDTFNNYSTIIKEFISKHRDRFFSNLATTKGF